LAFSHRPKLKENNIKRDTEPAPNKTVKKMKTKIWAKKKGEGITGGIFYCRDSGYLSVSATNILSCNDRSVLRIRQQKHTAKTLAATVADDTQTKIDNFKI
jgi:hypothetical protein